MSPSTIEERVRDYIDAERAQIPLPALLAPRLLHAVAVSRPARRRPGTGVLQLAAAIAVVLLLAAGITWMRTAQSASGLVRGSWSTTGSMAVSRGNHTATLLPDGRVLVVGGIQLIRPLASAELYDPRTRSWSSAGSLQLPRWGHTATLLANGRVLVVGGSQVDGYHLGSSSSVEMYDPRANSWSPAASMHTPRSFHTATLLTDGRVLIVGGVESSSDGSGKVLASAELYDPDTDAWSEVPPLSGARTKHDAILLNNDDVLVFGGTAGVGYNQVISGALRTAELYDPSTQTWSPAAGMLNARILPTALRLPDGRVLVVGDEGTNEATAEVFDLAGGWSPAAAPSVPRADAVGFSLQTGVVVVAGGVGQTTVEAFDWRHNSWSLGANLAEVRGGATATVLANGQVLVAGGYGHLSMPWTSAELYDPNGTSLIAATSTRPVPPPITTSALLIAFATLLLGLGLSLSLRRRLARQSRVGEIWVD
jgi:hypothetical protein